MNFLVSGPWATAAAWAAVITAVAALITGIVRVAHLFSRSFLDLMQTLEDDNSKLREALSEVEASRVDLANRLVQVHKEVAVTVEANSAIVQRLQRELDEHRQMNSRLIREVEQLKDRIAEYIAINQVLSDKIARMQPSLPFHEE